MPGGLFGGFFSLFFKMYPCHGSRYSGCPNKPISDISAAYQAHCTHETQVVPYSVNTPLSCPWTFKHTNWEKVNKQYWPHLCSSKREPMLPLMLNTKLPCSCFPNSCTSDCNIWPVSAIDKIFPFYSVCITAFWSHRLPWLSKWQLRNSDMPSVFENKPQQQQQQLSFSHPQTPIPSCCMAAVLFYSSFDDLLFTRDLVIYDLWLWSETEHIVCCSTRGSR